MTIFSTARLYILIALCAVCFIGYHSVVQAFSPIELTGYAWSSNIGWISFNCNQTASGGIDACGTSNYSVVISDTDATYKNLSGYAWSSNIGWIDIGPGLTGCPAGACAARADVAANELTGWARALSYGSGWDGWISFNCENSADCGTSNYAVGFNDAGSLSSYAWGSTVVGWVDFNTAFSSTSFPPPCPPSYACSADSLESVLTNMWCDDSSISCSGTEICSPDAGSLCTAVTINLVDFQVSGPGVNSSIVRKGDTLDFSWETGGTSDPALAVDICEVRGTDGSAATGGATDAVTSDPVNFNTVTYSFWCTVVGSPRFIEVTAVTPFTVQTTGSVFES